MKQETFTDRINKLYAEYQERQSKKGLRSSEDGFAKESGLSRQCIHEYLTKPNKYPDGECLLKLCKAHNISADWLLALTDDRSIDMEYKAAYKTLGLSEDAAATINQFKGPALNLFLNNRHQRWDLIMHDLGAFYACRKYLDDNSKDDASHEIVLYYQGSEIFVGLRDSVSLYARNVGDGIYNMLENLSTLDKEE